MNPKLKPYADFVEGLCEGLVEHQPTKIGVICMMGDGRSLTGFYGADCSEDKGSLAYHMLADAVMDEVFANAAGIVKAAEEQENGK